MALDQIFRRNRIENNGRFMVGGNVQNVLFEAGSVKDSDVGVEVTTNGGRWADYLDGGPTDILARNNQFMNVSQPYFGNRLKETKIIPNLDVLNTAIVPVVNQRQGWMERNEAINQKVKSDKVDLIYIGDSIVQNFESQGKDVWDYYYRPRNGLNMGISGDRTQHVLWRLDHGNIDGISPKLAVVMIGQNNGSHNTSNEITEGVTAVVQKLRVKLPNTKILLLGIFQRREKPTPEREVFSVANKNLSMLADNNHIFYMDINELFLRSDGSISSDLMPDFEHPSPLGHWIWAERIEAKVAELMGENPLPAMK